MFYKNDEICQVSRLESQKVRVQLELGFFSEANVLKKRPGVNPKVRVRLKLRCGLNKGFYGS